MPVDTEIQGSPSSIEGAADWLRGTLGKAVTSGADAMAAARAEQGRVERCKATMELTLALALAQPGLRPQTGVTLAGFKREIDSAPWLVVKLTPSLGDTGLTTQIELETRAA